MAPPDDDHEQQADRRARARRGVVRCHLYARWDRGRLRAWGHWGRRSGAGNICGDLARGVFGRHSPRLFISNVSSSISWAPNGQRIAFLRSPVTSSISTQLIVANADGGGERELARGEGRILWPSLLAPWRPNLPPAWSLDGQLIAVVGVDIAKTEGQVVFVDSRDRIRPAGRGSRPR